MTTYQTPGIYFERPRARDIPPAQRTDVAGFVGVAERGRLHTPVRVTNWREFQQEFGGFVPYAFLAYAVYAFFENGGAACWVVRVADADAARISSVDVPADAGGTAWIVQAANPGTWGDALTITLQPARLAQTVHVPIRSLPDDQLALERITGLYVGSRVTLARQVGNSAVSIVRTVTAVDPLTGVITLDAPIIADLGATHVDPPGTAAPIMVSSVECTLLVVRQNEVLERFADLGFEPAHPRCLPAIINAQSRQIAILLPDDAPGSALPTPELPFEGTLTGGLNGLRTLDEFDYIGDADSETGGLAALGAVDEVAILAMPDAVMQANVEPPLPPQHRVRIDPCALDAPRRNFTLFGQITDAESGLPLAGAHVTVDDGADPHAPIITSADGSYQFDSLLAQNIDLIVTRDQYETHQERLGTPTPGTAYNVALRPIDLPPRFSDDAIYTIQSALIAQCERQRDRFALLDAPLHPVSGRQRDLAQIAAWRRRFTSPFAALYYPWLIVRDPDVGAATAGAYTPRALPPSGHIAGVYAATDLDQGVFRAPANRALVFVGDVALPLDERMQSLLNPVGINAIRAFPGRGIRPFGACTLSLDDPFVNVRRFTNWLIETLHDGLQWVVFESINRDLQINVTLWIARLLEGLWRDGALVGDTPDAAFSVVCDDTTTPPSLRDLGQLVIEVGIAPTVPYEFIVLRLGFALDQLTISEVETP